MKIRKNKDDTRIWFSKWDEKKDEEIYSHCFEYDGFKPRIAFSLSFDDDDFEIIFHFKFFFGFFLSLSSKGITKFLKKHNNLLNKEIGFDLDLSQKTFSIDLFNNPWEREKRHFYIFLDDLFLGKAKFTMEITDKGETEIVMPEGKYKANYEIEKRTWKRPRWFTKTKTGIWFNLPVGIPHEGKGENSWDCGMDCTTGIGEEWNNNLYKCTKKVAMRCLKERQKYGTLLNTEYLKWKLENEKCLNKNYKTN